MTQPERYVFDTNVLISALLFVTSKPGQAVLMARERGVILLSAAVVWNLMRFCAARSLTAIYALKNGNVFSWPDPRSGAGGHRGGGPDVS